MDEKPKLTEKPGYFAIIPASVRYDKSLSPNAKLLYGEISCLLNFNNKCFASNAYFSRLYEISETQISRLISQLVNAGHIESSVEIKPTGTMRLLSMPLNIFVKGGVDKNVKGGVRKNVKHNKQIINIKFISEDINNVCFVEFWNIYGYKVGLKEAFKSWNKIDKVLWPEIIKKVPSWKLLNGEKILPYPATWLNQERWTDEVSFVKQPENNDYIIPTQYARPINHDDRP
jgi:hypothetical protein